MDHADRENSILKISGHDGPEPAEAVAADPSGLESEIVTAPEPVAGRLEWDLVLAEEDAARLARLKPLAPLREGRARSRVVRIIWHDGPDATLAKAGLTLAELRGRWRLEQMRPPAYPEPGATWPPGTVPPILAEAATFEELAALLATAGPGVPLTGLPAPCIPWAAFEGRSLTLSLRHAGEAVELTILQGVIRTVVHEHPTCRVLISGSAPASSAVALLLAGEVDLAVPRASLAALALAVARGAAPKPRALGAPRLSGAFTVAEAFNHIVGHLSDVILHWAPLAAAGDGGPEPVHQMRVATRRLRSALSVFRRAAESPSVADVDAGLKALGAALGPARDWDVFNAGIGAEIGRAFDPEQPEGKAVARLLAATERQRQAGYESLRRFVAEPEFRRLGIRLAALAAGRSWEREIHESARAITEMDLHDFAAMVLTRRWKRMFRDGEDIEHLETETLHEIRLRAKRLRYAAEFFAAIFPQKATRRFIERLSDLQEQLGMLNDGAVAAGLLASLRGGGSEQAFAIGAARGFVAASGGASRAGIAHAWKKFRKQEPFWN